MGLRSWLRNQWHRLKRWWQGDDEPIDIGPIPVLDLKPVGFNSWFAWESVQYTLCPSAFWVDPYRDGYKPTNQEIVEAQDRVAELFGLRVSREYKPLPILPLPRHLSNPPNNQAYWVTYMDQTCANIAYHHRQIAGLNL